MMHPIPARRHLTHSCVPLLGVLLAVALPPTAAAQEADVGGTLDTTVALAPGGTVDLGLSSGSITVSAWSRGEARVRATTEGGTLRFAASGARVALEVRGTQVGEARYELTVPVGTRLLMRSTSGTLTARGVGGEVDARTLSGDVEVASVADRATVESFSGSVTVRDVRGVLRATSVSGDLVLSGLAGDVETGTVSGEIEMRGVQSRLVRAESVSGDIAFAGAIDPAGRYDFRTNSGDVRLTIPESASALLGVETFSGELDSSLRLTLQPGTRTGGVGRRRLEFRLGGGGARIAVASFSGDITIRADTARSREESTP